MIEYVVVGVVVMAAVAYLIGRFACAAKGGGSACAGCDAGSAASNPQHRRKRELVQIRVEGDEAGDPGLEVRGEIVRDDA